MRAPGSLLHQVLAQTAVDASGASDGWLLRLDGDDLVVVGGAGTDVAGALGVRVAATAGSEGYVLAADQPLAIGGRSSTDRLGEGVPAALGRQPSSVLCVPCTTDAAVVGVLEVVDKQGGDGFSIDDVEVVSLLGRVAGAALADDSGVDITAPDPEALGGELRLLAGTDPVYYASVASVLGALLARG